MNDAPDALPKSSAEDSATSGTPRRVTSEPAAVVAKPTEFGGMLASISGVAIWLIFLIGQGLTAGLETIWLLVIGLALGAWTMLMRLRFSPGTLMFTIGPWQRTVDLSALDSVKWKMTGGGLSRGTIFVRDRTGSRVPIYVGRFTLIDEWGPLLLDAARQSDAGVDSQSRHLLEGSGAPRKRLRRQ